MELVLATRNSDKIREIKDALEGMDLKILTFRDFSEFPFIEEDKDSPYGNALKKARTIAQFTGKMALADDSGLEVEALEGAPGIFSSRFAGEGASYEDNNRKLLSLLKQVPLEKRKATFRCAIAISEGNHRERVVEGICEGRILQRMRGSNGFGYDPLFEPTGSSKTFAEMSLKEKEKISHRGRALRKARKILENWKNRVVIGLTGNIGSGKSTVAGMLAGLGAEIINADEIGHNLLKKKAVRKSVVQSFGASILAKNGEIKRRELGKVVFRDKKKLEELNRILHPLMFNEIKKRITFSEARIIIVDVAILLEAGWDSLVDKILLVSASSQARGKRIKEKTGLSSEEIDGIMRAQFSQDEKTRRADFLIENEGNIEETRKQVEQFWNKLVSRISYLVSRRKKKKS